jgi:hypothetical protein
MAKKQAPKAKGKTVATTVKEERTAKPVRLDLAPADYERLERCARERGLTRSSYARQAVLERIKADERETR